MPPLSSLSKMEGFTSQIDVRLEKNLGHFVDLFKNDNELSSKTLGPMHGEWGSFLPAQLRPPSVLVPEKANSSKRDNTLAPKQENSLKLNRENVQDGMNPHPDLKKDSENHFNCEVRSDCAVMFPKRKREDKRVGPSPKKQNLGVSYFSGLHTIPPGLLPIPAKACIKSDTLDPNEKRAKDVAPSTPLDNKEQRVQIITADNTLPLQEVRDQLKQAMEIHNEALDLEQRASRLKKNGQDGLSVEIYLESAIKYLHSAHILEPANWEKMKPGDADQSLRLYIHAGKLFEYVAHILQQWMQFVPAGLAYKCMEVAFMKAGFYKNMDISKDDPSLQVPCQKEPSANSTACSNIPPSLPNFLDYVSVMTSAFEGTRGYEKALRDSDNCAQDTCLFKAALNLDFHHMDLVLLAVRRALASRWSS